MIDRLLQNRRFDLFQFVLTALVSPFLVFVLVQRARHDVVSRETLLLTLTLVMFLARVRYPVFALLAQSIIAVGLAGYLDSPGDEASRVVLEFCLLSVALTRGRATVAASSFVVLVTTFGIAWRYGVDSSESTTSFTDYLALFAQAAASVGVGTAVRIQRQRIAEIQDRADRERRNREIEVRNSITEERLRIARELHDAVAHHIAVVSMFLGLARTTARTSPEKTEQTLASAQESARTVLSELQQILQLLREPVEPDIGHGQIEPPVPGLADIDTLVGAFRSAGMPVQVTREGAESTVPTQVGLAAYRVVQEALTNANKYGDGAVTLRVDFGARDLTLDVENAISSGRDSEAVTGAGLGLVGMSERVRLLGGTLEYGASSGIFRVSARLPLGTGSIEQERTGSVGSTAS